MISLSHRTAGTLHRHIHEQAGLICSDVPKMQRKVPVYTSHLKRH